MVKTANANGLRGGWALDLSHKDPVTGSEWDLSDPAAQAKVWKMLRRDKPLVVGMSPECTLFSQLQNICKTEIPKAEYERAVACVEFCAEVAHFQRKAGRYFYLEHPLGATSWNLDCLVELKSSSGVEEALLDMCQFGLKTADALGVGYAKKPTRILTNLPSIAAALAKRCPGLHRHAHLISGRAKAAAEYTEKFCQSIVDGIICLLECMQEVSDGGAFNLDFGEILEADEVEDYIPFSFDDSGWCLDDVRGGEIPMALVRAGREQEMAGFAAQKVYDVRPRVRCDFQWLLCDRRAPGGHDEERQSALQACLPGLQQRQQPVGRDVRPDAPAPCEPLAVLLCCEPGRTGYWSEDPDDSRL